MSERERHVNNFITRTYKNKRGTVDKNNPKYKYDLSCHALEYKSYLEAHKGCFEEEKKVLKELREVYPENIGKILYAEQHLNKYTSHEEFVEHEMQLFYEEINVANYFEYHKNLIDKFLKTIREELNQKKKDWDNEVSYNEGGDVILKYNYDTIELIEPIIDDEKIKQLVKIYFDIGKEIRSNKDRNIISNVCKVPLHVIVEIIKDFLILYEDENPQNTYIYKMFHILPTKSKVLTSLLNNYLLAYNTRWNTESTADQMQFKKFIDKLFGKKYQLDIKSPSERIMNYHDF